jgi:hypothetical protein
LQAEPPFEVWSSVVEFRRFRPMAIAPTGQAGHRARAYMPSLQACPQPRKAKIAYFPGVLRVM